MKRTKKNKTVEQITPAPAAAATSSVSSFLFATPVQSLLPLTRVLQPGLNLSTDLEHNFGANSEMEELLAFGSSFSGERQRRADGSSEATSGDGRKSTQHRSPVTFTTELELTSLRQKVQELEESLRREKRRSLQNLNPSVFGRELFELPSFSVVAHLSFFIQFTSLSMTSPRRLIHLASEAI